MTTATGTNRTYAVASSLLKKVYADRVEDMVPETDKMAKYLGFQAAEKQPGGGYIQPVTLSTEVGFTFNTDGGLFQLNKPIASTETYAEIQGSEFVGRTAMSYALLQRALKGDVTTRAGMRAFVQTTKDSVAKLLKGGSYAREAQLLYGGGTTQDSNLGVVSATTGSATTSLVMTFTTATWCTALWAGREGLECDIYSTAFTKRNSAGTAAAGDNVFKVTTVDAANYKVTFTSNATNVSNVVATDFVVFAGAYQKEMLGIDAVCSKSGTVWNISNATYALWKPQSFPVGGQLTFEKVLAGINPIAALGFTGEIRVFVNPATWQDLAEDQAALVKHDDKSGGDVSMGYESIKFYGQCGVVSIEPHIYVKRGMAFGLPKGECQRIGSTDLTMQMPGYDGKLLRELEDYAGVEARCYYDQAFFCKHPAYMIKYTGITNATD
jgi:hypothetical protein